MPRTEPYRSIVITGASAGLGAALACGYAAPGRVLGLTGRNKERLEAVAERCRDLGATVQTGQLDVTDRPAVERWIADFDAAHPIDLVVANAGVFTGHRANRLMETLDDVAWQIRTNLEGVAITAGAAVPHMRKRRRGTIAIIGSLAAYQPLADAPGYSASKAGVVSYGEALREYLADDNVSVCLVCPGHIETHQTACQAGALPLQLTPDKAAAIIRSGLAKGRTSIAFPRRLLWLIRVGRLLPWRMRARLGGSQRFHVIDPPVP